LERRKFTKKNLNCQERKVRGNALWMADKMVGIITYWCLRFLSFVHKAIAAKLITMALGVIGMKNIGSEKEVGK